MTWLPFYLVRGRHLSMNTMARDGGLRFPDVRDRCDRVGKTVGSLDQGGILAHLCSQRFDGARMLWLFAFVCHSGACARPIFHLDAGADRNIPRHQRLCNSWAIPQTLAGPEMVGRWIGMQNFVGNLAGAVAPALTGYLLDRTGSFYWPFFITAVVAWIGALSLDVDRRPNRRG